MHEIGAGRRAFPKSDAKRHHIVPQFLLANFAEPPTKDGLLYALDRKTGANRRVAVRDAANRHRFYAVETTEAEKDNRIEAFLGLIEDHAARSLSRLLDDPLNMRELDPLDIALFLTMQTQRTPAAVARAEDLAQKTAEQVFRQAAADPEAFASDSAEIAEKFGLTPEEVEIGRRELVKAIDEGRLKNQNIRGEAWVAIIDSWLPAAEYPLKSSWFLMRPERGEFVTSDGGFAGVPVPGGQEASETTFPLAPDSCLMIRTGTPGLRIVEIPKRDVDMVNLRTYAWAERFIYGRTQAAVTGVRELAKKKRRRVPPGPAAAAR
jgi:hypothetical protein